MLVAILFWLASFLGVTVLVDGVRGVGVSVFVTTFKCGMLEHTVCFVCLFFNGCLVPVSFAFYNVYTSGLSTQ